MDANIRPQTVHAVRPGGYADGRKRVGEQEGERAAGQAGERDGRRWPRKSRRAGGRWGERERDGKLPISIYLSNNQSTHEFSSMWYITYVMVAFTPKN